MANPKGRRRVAPSASTSTSPDEVANVVYTRLIDVVRWPRNPKLHDYPTIKASLRRFGMVDPVIYDEASGKLVAGHGRVESLEQMRESGEAPPRRIRVDTDGEWMLPVVRGVSFESEHEAEAYLVTNNRLVELGGWNEDGLAAILDEHRDNLDGIGYDAAELDSMIADLAKSTDVESTESERSKALEDLTNGHGKRGRTVTDPEERAEAAEAYYEKINAQPRAKSGDVWKLGDHVLICGDSGEVTTLERVLGDRKVDAVITDPPYAIFGSSTGISGSIADDRMVVPFFEMVVRTAAMRLRLFGHLLFFCDWRSWSAIVEAHRRCSLPVKNMIVWDKGGGLGSMYAQCHELVLFSVMDPPLTSIASRKVTGNRMVHAKNVIRENRAHGDDRPHNASKPIALVRGFIERHTEPGETVLDMFIGGGTTLLGCELTGRKCVAIDVDAKWIDVVIARWEHMTDRKAELVMQLGPVEPSETPASGLPKVRTPKQKTAIRNIKGERSGDAA